MNGPFILAAFLFVFFLGMATVGIIYSTPMPFIAWLVIGGGVGALIAGLIQEAKELR